VTVLQSAHPAAASLLGREEEANHFVSETLSTTVQVPVGIPFLPFILLIVLFSCIYISDEGG
jgi:hypothetical protein